MATSDPFPFSTGDEILEQRLAALFNGEPDPHPMTAEKSLERRLRALFNGEPDPEPYSTGDKILEIRLQALGG